MFFELGKNAVIHRYQPKKTSPRVRALRESESDAKVGEGQQDDHHFDYILKSISDQTADHQKSSKSPSQVADAIESYEEVSQPDTSAGPLPTLADQIMSSPVITFASGGTVDEAIKKSKENGIRHFPVIDEEHRLLGIVSDRDLFQAEGDQVVDDLLGEKILTAGPKAPLAQIAAILVHEDLGCLPIVDQNRTLLGIVSRTDILEAIIRKGSLDLTT